MSTIGQLLDKMVIRATSPDGNIRSTITNDVDVDVAFRPGSYAGYTRESLSHQLVRLAALTFTGLHKGRDEAYKNSQGLSDQEVAESGAPHWDANRRRYDEALSDIEAAGISRNQLIRIRSKGVLQWKVDIKPGALERLDESAFRAELHSAIAALLGDRSRKIIVLKSEYFDLGIPAPMRRKMAELQAMNR